MPWIFQIAGLCDSGISGVPERLAEIGQSRGFRVATDTVGESFEPNVDAAQKAGTLTELAKRMNLAQRSVPRK
jgi:hypothetical protein